MTSGADEHRDVSGQGSSQGGSSLSGWRRFGKSKCTFKDNRYKYLSDLGRGGMSRVIRARDLTLKRDVAVKVMLAQADHTPDAFRRFQREAQTAGQLNHPGIVNILDFGLTTSNEPFLVMELLEGQSLASYLKKKGGRLSQGESFSIVIDICSALEHAHKYDVLHRDIKPANVIVLKAPIDQAKLKVIDFGLAKFGAEDQALTKTGVAIGSPPYMSPEQCAGKKVDVRSEVYSVGCVLFELLTGKKPFRADNALEMISMQMNAPRPSLNETLMDVDFSESTEKIVARCMAIHPEDRYQNVSDLKTDLEIEFARFAQVPGQKLGIEAAEPYSKTLNPYAFLFIALGIAAIVLIPAGAFFFLDPLKPKDYAVPFIYESDKHRERKSEFDKQMVDASNPFRLRSVGGHKVLEANTWSEITEEHMKKIAHRRDFTRLKISKVEFSGRGLRFLADNETLKELDLLGNELDAQGWKELSTLSHIRNLSVSFPNDFGDADISSVANLTGIKSLRVVSNKITANELRQLATIPHLKDLTLSHSREIEPGALSTLAASRTMDSLNIRSSKLTKEHFEELAVSPKLGSLVVDKCLLSNASVKAISELKLWSLGIHAIPVGPKLLSPLLASKTLKVVGFYGCPGFTENDAKEFVRKFKRPVAYKFRPMNVEDNVGF
jgi:hypothetical protein